MSTLTTRLATAHDAGSVAILFDAYRQFYGKAPDLALAREFIRDRIATNESVVIVAENGRQGIVGFCQLYPTFCSVAAARICVLYDLFVKQEARHAGAGRALMLAAEAHAAGNGFVRMELSTAKTNLEAQSLYQSLGWIREEAFYVYSRALQR